MIPQQNSSYCLETTLAGPWLSLKYIHLSHVEEAVFVVSNLITAIIVENAFAIAQEDQDSLAKVALALLLKGQGRGRLSLLE